MFFGCEEGCCRLAPNAVNSKATVMSARNEVRVGADELDFRGEFFPEHGEESLEGFYGSFFADPEQASGVGVDLIDQGEVLVALGKLDLVDPDGRDRGQGAML